MLFSTAVRSGAALLGQAASPQELPGAVATADVPPGVQSVPSPSISVLLVDVYYLRDWVPSRNLVSMPCDTAVMSKLR